MTLQATPATPGALVVDTDTKLTPYMLDGLELADYNGQRCKAIGRYVGLSQNGGHDIDQAELEAITSRDLACFLIQHVRYPGWSPSGQLGAADGASAARNARAAQYAEGCHLFCDLEGVPPGTPAQYVIDYCDAWSAAVRGSYEPALYVGYQAILSPEQLWELPDFHLYARDSGPRVVAHRGVAWSQFRLDVMFGGVKVDLGTVSADMLGSSMLWCAAGPGDVA